MFHWAFGIEVDHRPDCLFVGGYSPYWQSGRGRYSSWDLLAEFRKAPKDWSKGRTGKNSPHVQFANAETDDELIAFVKRFGPVVARSIRETFPEELNLEGEGDPPTIVAEQGMDELRNERITYRSALTLLSELQLQEKDKKADIEVIRDCISRIADKVSAWPQQWTREQQARVLNYASPPSWQFNEAALRGMQIYASEARSSRPSLGDRVAKVVPEAGNLTSGQILRAIDAGHSAICELVNAFKPVVYRWGGVGVEGPHFDLCYGIRPLLYHILRQEYLRRGGIAFCANTRCNNVFNTERAGQRFCSTECSQQQRQRDYWAISGKRKREQRRKREKAAAKKAARKGQ